MRQLPSLLGLTTFDAVARHLSFSKAAREFHISQGAVSHRLRGLEEELGVTLLLRSSRRVQLTELGRVLFRATEEAFARLRIGLAEMEASASPHRVTVSCSPSFAIRWLVPHLGDLRERVPGIDIHISADDTLVEPGVGSIDVCIRFGPGGYEGVEAERLTDERVTPVCSPFYVERVGIDRVEDLDRCVLLHDDVLVGHAAHVGWREWLDEVGLDDMSAGSGLHFSHSHLALDAAIAAQGVAIARRTLVRRDLAAGRLVTPFDMEVASGLTYWLITPRNRGQTGAVSAFCAWLRDAIGAETAAGAKTATGA